MGSGLRGATPHSCHHLVPHRFAHPSLAARSLRGGGPNLPSTGMPSREGWRWRCQPPHPVQSLSREQEEGLAPPQGAGMSKARGCRQAAPHSAHIGSAGHMDFAVGLGHLGLSWMYDTVIIIVIIILLVCLSTPCNCPPPRSYTASVTEVSARKPLGTSGCAP